MPTMFPIEHLDALVRTGGSARVDTQVPAGFKPGDRVTVANINPVSHTRLPRYARGRTGTVRADHGVFVFPDTNAELRGEKPQHVYSVAFDATELWGSEAPAKDKLYIDLFEDYLLPMKRGSEPE